MTDFTTHLHLYLPDFNISPWHDEIHDNFRIIDAAINLIAGVTGLQGIWTNSTSYVIGNKLIDTDGSLWLANVDHISAASPTTFAEDRVANPTYWSSTAAQTSPVLDAIASLTPAANRLINFTGVDTAEVITISDVGKALIAAASAAAQRTLLELHAVAASGVYADLTGKPDLATVATTGVYSDLTGKPTIIANSAVVDNRLLRSDGTGGNVQQSGIAVDDTDNVSGVTALTMNGALSGVTSFSLSGTVTFSSSNFGFLADTSDGADTKSSFLGGGGGFSTTRGSLIVVYGNEHAVFPGQVRIISTGTAPIELIGATNVTGNLAATGTVAAAGNMTANGNRVAELYQGSLVDNTIFPVGTTLLVGIGGTTPERNATVTVRLSDSNSTGFANTGTGALLQGTWRSRGYTSGDNMLLAERVG